MTGQLTLRKLEEVAEQVIGLPGLRLRPEMSASEIPGWDSLNHTIIMLEVSNLLHVEIGAEETAQLPNFEALLSFANARAADMARHGNIARP